MTRLDVKHNKFVSVDVYPDFDDCTSVSPILTKGDLTKYVAFIDYHKTRIVLRARISLNLKTKVPFVLVFVEDWTYGDSEPAITAEMLAEATHDALIAFSEHPDFQNAFTYYATVAQDPDPEVLHFLFKVMNAKYQSII